MGKPLVLGWNIPALKVLKTTIESFLKINDD